ncbi:Retrotransposable element Tf2 protein type 1 [Aphis craccivora]|uniref:Retrotransposable element Tf2 protein type 1 n=1 Tax=Aphis craccivora TaxID=307492 RepID=A0A6G0YK33_APHCR|nr:Retrotransposable element Tf2 protein type 1 [Aphis craccivora]
MERVEDLIKRRIKKMEERTDKEIENIKLYWEKVYKKKTEEIEEKYIESIQQMEERYIDTFRNFNEKNQQSNENQNIIHRSPATEIAKPMFYGNNRDHHPKDYLYNIICLLCFCISQ